MSYASCNVEYLKRELSYYRLVLRREIYKREPNVFELEAIQREISEIKNVLNWKFGIIVKSTKYER